ncbi:hypothetical protein EUTSA_v10015986mg [Eutrema salsugineum]|uniref:F-box domain-containing protein n=1 Tax=Eutrema salsugineum TaxID=72664 RepID=V4KXK0_EUTSA|nr:F-box/FBD/LRR-repeat protein At5g56420 [Eutrema salsugineum]ESQ42735.1 hypothetical protein EUTSA_v10015986mg [Eutrema salsugineum]
MGINELPDDLLLRILSLVQTKTVFDAQVLSKRWRNLWRQSTSLFNDYTSHKSESKFLEFIDRTMELLESPVLERFYLRIAPTDTSSSSVVLRRDLLAKRPVRELDLISNNPNRTQITKAIYQFQTLVILRLESFSLEDHYGNLVSLQSLKVLQLCRVKYSSDESLSDLLSNLPSLEELILDRCLSVKPAATLSIAVPCLRRLTVVRCPDTCRNDLMMLKVNAPSLKYLNVEDYWRNVSFGGVKMEELVEADVNATFIDTEKLLRTIISVKRLSLCLVPSKIPQINDFFDQLVRLEICTCQQEWWDILERVLLDSPKLRVLKLHQKHSFGISDPTVRWKEPSSVPECFAYHLETFEWRGYEGTEEEKKLASYILKNARRLKIATFYPLISHPDNRMHQILRKELENISRYLFTCDLVFK